MDFVMAALLAALAGGCHSGDPAATGGAAKGDDPKFTAIAAEDTISVAGTEPFWSGKVASGQFTYATSENQAGEIVAVRRFAGNNGLGFSGSLRGGVSLDLTITPGKCSDGMSHRTYPYTATLKIGDEQRSGCASTERP